MKFQTSALINYVYCIVARSRLTDVATRATIEWETLNSGDTLHWRSLYGCTYYHLMIRAATKSRAYNVQKYGAARQATDGNIIFCPCALNDGWHRLQTPRPLACWDRGFESQRGHGYLSVVSVMCCQVGRRICDELITRREESYRLCCP
jgi:hypothetical protein